MKKLILLLVAAATCVIFTACPNKPDEGVVIPDGFYEETAHLVRYDVEDMGMGNRKEFLAKDSVYVTQVLIDKGEFVYQDMCSDTFQVVVPNGEIVVRYNTPFIYLAMAYCPSIFYQNGEVHISSVATNPARMSSDGFVIIPAPQFSDFGIYGAPYRVDSNYVYRASVSGNEGVFHFEQNHEFYGRMNKNFSYKYHIKHTLRPI